MKIKRLAFLSLAVAALLPSMTSCSSDPNPFDITVSNEKQTATIQLRLNVEETRAGALSTAEENAIKKLTVHVFDDKHNLETTKSVTLSDGATTVNLEVSHGLKTLYVVTAKSNVNPEQGTSLFNYEKSTFNSSLDNIMPAADGFVMVGKSGEQQVMMTSSQDNLPQSNVFDITLKRLVAKAQVKATGIDGTSFGIAFGDASFRAVQLNERMRVLHNGEDVHSLYVDSNNNGTYDGYSMGNETYLNAVSDDFKAEGCSYLSENIVTKPLSGNTTFLSIRFQTTPLKYYTFTDSSLQVSSDSPTANTTYYAVGITDLTNGLVDYALDANTKHILTFKTQEDAVRYTNSLNNGDAATITVSQTERPMMVAPAIRKAAEGSSAFEVIEFKNGLAYYRVNIAHLEDSGDSKVNKYKVVRNKFYKVNVNSVSSLGFSSEALLRPSKPDAVLNAESHGWISANISVAE